MRLPRLAPWKVAIQTSHAATIAIAPRGNASGAMSCAPPRPDVMPALFDALAREYCRARLAEMRTPLLHVKRPRRDARPSSLLPRISRYVPFSHASRAKGMVRPGACVYESRVGPTNWSLRDRR
jgi:hypothetical protein